MKKSAALILECRATTHRIDHHQPVMEYRIREISNAASGQ